MNLARLGTLTSRVTSKTLLQGFVAKQSRHSFQTKSEPPTVKKDDDDNGDEKPIKYSTSPAASWMAKNSQMGGKDDSPWYQPPIVLLSCGIFLIYFLYLREPNDIDEIFERELGDYFPDSQLENFAKTVKDGQLPPPRRY